MIILLTTSKYPTSWLIRKLTGEDCSHCAVYLPEEDMVLHVNFLGFRGERLGNFRKHNEIKHQVVLANSEAVNTIDLTEKYGHVRYDFKALLYSGFRILFKMVGIRLPKVNLWQTTGMFLCTEFVTDLIDKKEDSLITPHQLYNKLTAGEKV